MSGAAARPGTPGDGVRPRATGAATSAGAQRRRTLVAFMRKEVDHILRDRRTLTVLLLMPLVQVVLFGFALRTDVRDIRLAVVDPAPDAATLQLRGRFAASDRFRIVAVAPTTDAVEPLFRRGQADLALVFAPDFAQHLGTGRPEEPARLLLVSDASDPNSGSTMQAYASAVIAGYQADLRAGGAGSAAGPGIQIVPEVRMRFNPTLESVNLFVPGLIALVLSLVGALMTAISLAREKESGAYEVLLVSPLRPWQIIVGKVLPYLALGMTNVLTALAAARLIFGIPLRGSVALLLAESLLFMIVALALGVLIAARTDSQQAAMMAAAGGMLMPTAVLSGMIFPIASMPGWLQPVTYIVPARWFIVIARGIMLKGIGLHYLWLETAVLAGMALLLLTGAIRSFRARL